MIEKVVAYKVGDECFLTTREAMVHGIKTMLDRDVTFHFETDKSVIADWIVQNRKVIVELFKDIPNENYKDLCGR